MKSIAGYVVAALLFAVVGGIALAAGLLDSQIARAQQQVVQAQYEPAQETFQSAEHYYGYASRLPWIGNGPANEMRTRQATLEYMQKHYVTIAPPDVADPIANVPVDNVDLQFLVANATFRGGLARAKDRASTLSALDGALNAYSSVLRNAASYHGAAYNYEYVVRLRTEVDKGKRKGPIPQVAEAAGKRGHPPTQADMARFKVYVPLEGAEIDKDAAGKAAKQKPIQKKG